MIKKIKELMSEAGLKHRPGEGYCPDLDPYQHYIPRRKTDVTVLEKILIDGGFSRLSEGTNWKSTIKYISYERRPHGCERVGIEYDSADGHIIRAVHFISPIRD